jgi:hypothetical protein
METGGIFSDIYDNFILALEPLIQVIDDDVNDGVWIRLEDGELVKLDKDPNLGDYEVDTDGDGIPDLIELNKIVTTFIQVGDTSYLTEAWSYTTHPGMQDTDSDGLMDGLDKEPKEFDARVVEQNEEYIKLNNGKKWEVFGVDIYGFYFQLDNLDNIYLEEEMVVPWEELGDYLEILSNNKKYEFNETELALFYFADTNGVRDYLDGRTNQELREKVFVKITERMPKYYKHNANPFGEEWIETTDKEGSWLAPVYSEADLALNICRDLDDLDFAYFTRDILPNLIVVGVVAGVSFVALGEIALIMEASAEFGLYNAITMYTNAGSQYVRIMLADWSSDGDSDVAEIAAQWQTSKTYPNSDVWNKRVLKKGDIVYGLDPGQSEFYTTAEFANSAGTDAQIINEALQLGTSPKHPLYRQ